MRHVISCLCLFPSYTDRLKYESFWTDPSSVSFLGISMLFSILHTGSRISQATGRDNLSTDPAKPSFIRIAGQSLLTGGYEKARLYSVEALLLYGICKYTDNQDQDVNAWMIMGVTARLAMRIGYHRDPRHLSKFSPFEREVRRRVLMIVDFRPLALIPSWTTSHYS